MSARILPLLFLSLFLAACGGAQSPKVKVLGVAHSPAKSPAHKKHLLVYLEVVNPSGRRLELSRFQYAFLSDGATRGSGDIALRRELSADSAAIVEVPVELLSDSGASFSLEGKLYATDNKVTRSWKVLATGSLTAGVAVKLAPVEGPESAIDVSSGDD